MICLLNIPGKQSPHFKDEKTKCQRSYLPTAKQLKIEARFKPKAISLQSSYFNTIPSSTEKEKGKESTRVKCFQ